ncbi:hypothetical protein M1O52_04865 [Dehalococcoidia bacterium]|nr:hypothetical protein [Dehalococcoidia bacterium]
MSKDKRNWFILCPVCGRAYTLNIWVKILSARPRGVLGVGCPRGADGRFLNADAVVVKPEVLDEVINEVGFFERFKARFITAIKNWLGNRWLLPLEIGDELLRVKSAGGFLVADVGPGYVERWPKKDAVQPTWMDLKAVPGWVAKADQQNEVWG